MRQSSPATHRSVAITPSGPLTGAVVAPSSKSISNRLLVIAALASGRSELRGVLSSDDTRVMAIGLGDLGAGISPFETWGEEGLVVVEGTDGIVVTPPAAIDAGLSGTTLRWLSSVALLARGTVTLDGEPPLRLRPLGGLLEALRGLGAEIGTDGGRPPLRITSWGFLGGAVDVDAASSSQFVTGLLLVSPYAARGVSLSVRNLGAAGYVDLTIEAMSRFGVEVEARGSTYVIGSGQRYVGRQDVVEYDASAAAHLFALAMSTGGSVTVANAVPSKQPDARIVEIFEEMGGVVSRTSPPGVGVTVARPSELRSVEVDISVMPDQLPTLAALGALASGRTRISGISVSRGHETDRVAAIARELGRLGADVEVEEDSLTVNGGRHLSAAVVETYHDHRMAMALSSVAAVVPGVVITEPGCVRKTYPRYWSDAEGLGLELEFSE